uniref:DNA polymerase epsilon subunit 3 n=1 Tax=Globodera pallida TaxID=36090 RepID=A0A183CBD9_GLOPA
MFLRVEGCPVFRKLSGFSTLRIIKEALPEGVTVSKEAKNAIARSAAIFILHATSLANDNAQSKKRKNLTADDILYAIHQLECDELEKPVKEALALFSQKKDQRQQHRREKRAENAVKNREKKQIERGEKGESEEIGREYRHGLEGENCDDAEDVDDEEQQME